MALYADLDALRASAADVRIVTSDGQTIAAHSYVLVRRFVFPILLPRLVLVDSISVRGC